MAADLKTMLVLSRMKLGDIAVRKFPEPLLIAAANEGKNELVKIIRQACENYFQEDYAATIPVAASPNASEITLPTDFASLREIRITTAGYEDIEFAYLNHSDPVFRIALIDGGAFANGAGTFFYDIVADRTLRLAPGSDMALAATISYMKTVPDMQLPTDYPVGIPLEHYDFIVTWIICEGMRAAKDPRLADYLAKMEYQKDMIVVSINDRQVKEPKFVTGYMQHEEW